MVEKPALEDAPSNLASFGRYLLSPTVMELLATTEPGAGGEIQLTDALVSLLDREDMYALVIDPSDGYDTGTVPSWIAANVAQAMKDPKIAAYLKETVGPALRIGITWTCGTVVWCRILRVCRTRRDGRAVECNGLENRQAVLSRLQGSNPCPSASSLGHGCVAAKGES